MINSTLQEQTMARLAKVVVLMSHLSWYRVWAKNKVEMVSSNESDLIFHRAKEYVAGTFALEQGQDRRRSYFEPRPSGG
jgi:hypothetical protein